MSARTLWLPLALAFGLLAGCSPDDPLSELEGSVQRLQDNLAGKNTRAVLEQLADDFRTQDGSDRQWARQTMAGLFIRHRNIHVVAPAKRSWIDPSSADKGHTEATVGLAGAEGVLPDRAQLYQVRLEWWRQDGEWRLARLTWD